MLGSCASDTQTRQEKHKRELERLQMAHAIQQSSDSGVCNRLHNLDHWTETVKLNINLVLYQRLSQSTNQNCLKPLLSSGVNIVTVIHAYLYLQEGDYIYILWQNLTTFVKQMS